MSFARGILAFGDLYLLALGGFLMIAVRLAAPVMIAVAIDRNLANKISYSNQAEREQAQGQFIGEVTRAGAAFEGGNISARANRIRSITGIEGSRISSVAGIYGGLTRATGAINAERNYAIVEWIRLGGTKSNNFVAVTSE